MLRCGSTVAAGRIDSYKPRGAGRKRSSGMTHFPLQEPEMAIERTFSILKPDATRRNLTGAINAVIEGAGLRIVAQKRVLWTKAQAEKFYEEHKARPFYGELVTFMTSGPIVLQVLEGEGAIAKYREVMGATDPAEAKAGTVRKQFAVSKGENSTHGSDSPESAEREIALNFRLDEIVG
jgi:nucleoside-diphosphate kinase